MKATEPVQLHVGVPPGYPAQFTNTGKTVAKNIRAKMWIEIVSRDQESKLSDIGFTPPHVEMVMGALFPTGHAYYWTTRKLNVGPNRQVWRPATEAEVSAYTEGFAYVAIYGVVTYDDIFGPHHWTRFCKWVTSGPNALKPQSEECTEFNSVDSND